MADEARRPGRLARVVAVALLGWLALASSYYLAFPLFGVVSLAGWLVIGGCWLWTIVGSVAAVVALIGHRAYVRAVTCVVVAALAGTAVWMTDWSTVYVDSQFRLRHSALVELAARYRAGKLAPDAELPWHLRYLSLDGHAHDQNGALYLPVWQDWRAENGGGFGYFPTPPKPDRMITTAAGDIGHPVRLLGDGWWWVD